VKKKGEGRQEEKEECGKFQKGGRFPDLKKRRGEKKRRSKPNRLRGEGRHRMRRKVKVKRNGGTEPLRKKNCRGEKSGW